MDAGTPLRSCADCRFAWRNPLDALAGRGWRSAVCQHPEASAWMFEATGGPSRGEPFSVTFCELFRAEPDETVRGLAEAPFPEIAERWSRVIASACGPEAKHFERRLPWWQRIRLRP